MDDGEFLAWWESYRNNTAVPAELKDMEDYYVQAGLIKYSSKYWNFLNRMGIKEITEYGYENFKQTITTHYFTWVVGEDHPYAAKLRTLVPQVTEKISLDEINKKHDLFSLEQSIAYNKITELFLNYILQNNGELLLSKLEEPLIGNPPCVLFHGKRISQDILNSLLEYMSISKAMKLEKCASIIEIGAGSGRTAFCFMTLLSNVKYIIVDFPPALYVSQRYLTTVFPEKKVMKFRSFDNFASISEEFFNADLIFLTPDQLKKIPNKSCDLFLAIDCLHEMRPDMIVEYFNEVERLSSYFYFKCWQDTVVPFDHYSYNSGNYPVHSNWKEIFKEPCVVPSDFFHVFYKISDLNE